MQRWRAGELWRLGIFSGGGEETWGNLPGEEGGGLSWSQRTCRGVLETSSPQDMHLGHQLGVTAQGAPARARRLIQAQLPETGQRRGGRSQRGVRKMEDKGVQEEGRGEEQCLVRHCSSWANALGFLLLYPHPRVPHPSPREKQFTEHLLCAKPSAGML